METPHPRRVSPYTFVWSTGFIIQVQLHNLKNVYRSCRKLHWPRYCGSTSPPSAPSPSGFHRHWEPRIKSSIPPQYHKFSEVFNKIRTLDLPPHRPWPCIRVVDFIPRTRSLWGTHIPYHLYPLHLKIGPKEHLQFGVYKRWGWMENLWLQVCSKTS